jgi:arsenite methyltransferase
MQMGYNGSSRARKFSCCTALEVNVNENEIRKAVRDGYADIARRSGGCCGPATPCCGGTDKPSTISRDIGYTEQDLKAVPEGANLGLGCGNPVALASLRAGERVLDLGSGAGLDCFLAASRVGQDGTVIGVDMTPEMVAKARENAGKGEYANVEFRLGEIENLPVADCAVDVVISNCVVNLSPDKRRVFREIYRVLKPGGRLMVSDIVLLGELPGPIRDSVAAYVGCIAGASMRDEYIQAIEAAGFRDVEIVEQASLHVDLMSNDPTAKAVTGVLGTSADELQSLARLVASVRVRGIKPDGAARLT